MLGCVWRSASAWYTAHMKNMPKLGYWVKVLIAIPILVVGFVTIIVLHIDEKLSGRELTFPEW
jgi:hypothetical protein